MTYLAQELSREDGQPVELYAITLGGQSFNFTSGEDAITVDSVDYQSAYIKRTEIGQGNEHQKQTVSVTMRSNQQPASLFRGIVPPNACVVEILRVHRTDGTLESYTIFEGTVRAVKFVGNGLEATLQVVPETEELNAELPRYTFQGLCNHTLYDTRCKVLKALFEFPGTVSVVTGTTLTIPGLSAEVDQYYRGGYVELGAGEDFRLILDHTGNVVNMPLPFPDDAVGASVKVFAGCDHSIATCKAKFNNVINYGGFAFVPRKDIFRNGLN